MKHSGRPPSEADFDLAASALSALDDANRTEEARQDALMRVVLMYRDVCLCTRSAMLDFQPALRSRARGLVARAREVVAGNPSVGGLRVRVINRLVEEYARRVDRLEQEWHDEWHPDYSMDVLELLSGRTRMEALLKAPTIGVPFAPEVAAAPPALARADDLLARLLGEMRLRSGSTDEEKLPIFRHDVLQAPPGLETWWWTAYLCLDAATAGRLRTLARHEDLESVSDLRGMLTEAKMLVESADLGALQQLVDKQPAVLSARDAAGNTLMHDAASQGRADVVGLLIGRGANPGPKGQFGREPLHCACLSGSLPTVDLLLSSGVNVNARSQFGTPVMELSLVRYYRGCRDAECGATLESLVHHGADINAPMPDGTTPLINALVNRDTELARWLLAHGADVAAATQGGWTPLHYALGTGDQEIVTTILDRGADVNATTSEEGWTPLHLQARWGRTEMIALLLSHNADSGLRSTEGITPLGEAERGGHEGAAALLKGAANGPGEKARAQ